MHVIATAGHVDHGKSTLVRALTGIEPDRWDEERRRGLTIDLGFAWTALPSSREVSFVDVPGHERFLGNMLAGLGPSPVVCFVVAADEGWQMQSSDHRDAVAALGIDAGVIVVTRTDRAPDRVPEVLAEARRELAGTGLAEAPAVEVSATQGTGLQELRSVLDRLLATVPGPALSAPVRIWIDRSFTVAGAGTVVSGTLAAGTLRREEQLQLVGEEFTGPVTVRGLQSRHQSVDELTPVSRAAVNLRGASLDQVGRGSALLTPGAWVLTDTLDVRRSTGADFTTAPEQLHVHVGTAAVHARCRAFDDDHARLTLSRVLPLRIGDRLVLRRTNQRAVLGGAQVLDLDPPELTRRGAGARRARTLHRMTPQGDVALELARRGTVRENTLQTMGVEVPAELPETVRRLDTWLVSSALFDRWCAELRTGVEQDQVRDPLSGGLSDGSAADLIGLPDVALLGHVVAASGLRRGAGTVTGSVSPKDLGRAEDAVAEIERELSSAPFQAPEAHRLATLGLGERELAAAERRGRLLRLAEGIVLLPSAPSLAMEVLAGLDQPFTTSAARKALKTTRRTVIPLLEHLDAEGRTRRLDPGHRITVR